MKSKDIALQGVFLALLILCSWVNLPIGPVPITLSVFAVLLIGGVLSPFNSIMITIVYLLLGILGLPIFSNFSGGIVRLAGPTGGFLISYPLMTAVVAFALRLNCRFISYVISMTLAMIICYTLGVTFMIINLKLSAKEAFFVGVLPFVVADIFKIACAAIMSYRLNKLKIFARLNS